MYTLEGKRICKAQVLTTLGYEANNDSIIRSVFDKMDPDSYALNVGTPTDKRWRAESVNKYQNPLEMR